MDLKKIMVCLAIVLFALLMVVAFMWDGGDNKKESDSSNSDTTTASTQNSTQSTSASGNDSPSVPEYSVCVSTIYGNLYYQDQWFDFMMVEQLPGENSLTVAFCAKINEDIYPLFTFYIGESTGSPVGQITDASGIKRDVCVVMEDIGDISRLTSGEQNRLYGMQEDINFVIENLR